jgi:hypothetical protein
VFRPFVLVFRVRGQLLLEDVGFGFIGSRNVGRSNVWLWLALLLKVGFRYRINRHGDVVPALGSTAPAGHRFFERSGRVIVVWRSENDDSHFRRRKEPR